MVLFDYLFYLIFLPLYAFANICMIHTPRENAHFCGGFLLQNYTSAL
jgi:hypothetical protein